MAQRRPTRLLMAVALAAAVAWPDVTAWAQAPSPQTVLVIHWSSEDYPSTPVVDAAIRKALLSSPDAPVDYFAEYLESDRFPGDDATLAFRDYIHAKYLGRRIDVVLAITDPALQFVLRHRAALFPDAPVVAATSSVLDGHDLEARLTGVAWRAAEAETLELALDLHPSTQRVFVVAQALTAGYLDGVRATLARFRPRAEITFISERSVPRLIAAIRAVPARSLILFIRYSQQDPGNVMFPNEVARLVAEASPVPVYVSTDSHVGTGAVGGVVRVAPAIGRRVGEIARRVLDGTPPQDIPFEDVPVSPVFDWRQVKRWGIDPYRLPAGSETLFRVPTVWELYGWYIVGALSLIVFQTLLVVTLLVQRRQRRRVAVALRDSEEKARASYHEVRDLAGRLITAREGERTRIARDLHDDIGQRVASLSIALSRIQRQIPEAPDAARQSLSDLEQQATRLSTDLRHLSHELHPGALEHLGLLEALRERCDDFSQEAGVRVQFDVSESWRDVPDTVALCLYRVAQEALRNIATHARAQNVTVSLDRVDGYLTMRVADDGCGFNTAAPSKRSGLGLVSLSERVRMLGGVLDITAAQDAGTCIAVRLPTGESHAAQSTAR